MFSTLNVGDKVQLSGGYEMEPKWLDGKSFYTGTVIEFILGQNKTPAVVIQLDLDITFDDTTGDILVLELRYEGAEWKKLETVYVELCSFVPESKTWKLRKQGKWVESHASYVKL